ncbi:MAG: sugar phosphate nucleotidyltransferase [Myxococcota bacterium]
MQDLVVIVLSGGAGSRLWPASRPDRPKPLLALAQPGASLLRSTVERFAPLGPVRVRCAPHHAPAIAAELPGVPIDVEPLPRGTGPAIGDVARASPADTLVLVTPADHHVERPDVLLDAIRAALPAARAGRVVTFGIVPTRPATEYGWIEVGPPLGDGVHHIASFVEKPPADRAAELLAAGHLWNAGLFLFRAGALVDELERWCPGSPAGSFDVQVMQRTDRGAVVPVDCGWSDLGTWTAVASSGRSDPPASFTWTDGPTVQVLGVPDVWVVASAGGVLVTTAAHAHTAGSITATVCGTVDHGPGWSVHRSTLAAGEAVEIGPLDRATVVAGAGRGAQLPSGRFVAEGPCVLVVVRLTPVPAAATGGG